MIRNEDFIFGLKLIEKMCHLKFKVVLISSSYAWIFASWHMRTTQIYSSFQKLDLSMQKMFWNQIQTIFLLCIWYWHNIIIELSQPVHSSETDNFKPYGFLQVEKAMKYIHLIIFVASWHWEKNIQINIFDINVNYRIKFENIFVAGKYIFQIEFLWK